MSNQFSWASPSRSALPFQRLLERSQAPLVLVDLYGQVIYANSSEALLGYPPGEYLTCAPQIVVHPADWVNWQTFWQLVCVTPGATQTSTLRCRHQQGRDIWINLTATNLLNDPDIGAILLNHQEVTAQKQAAAREESLALVQAEQMRRLEEYTLFWRNSMDGLLLVNADLCIQQTNAAGQQIFGCAPSDAHRATLQDFIDPADLAAIQENSQNVLNTQMSKRCVARCRRRAGPAFEAEFSFSYLSPASLGVTVRVITDHTHAQAALGFAHHQHPPLTELPERPQATQWLEANLSEGIAFQKQLQILHEISIELTLVDELDTFYKQIVQLGLTRLGFERMSLFLYEPEQNLALGTYGTDTTGHLRAFHHLQFTLKPDCDFLKAMQTPNRFYLREKPRFDQELTGVGASWNASVALWHGNRNLGWLVADNLLHQAPILPRQLEIMAQYGMYIAASMARKQTEAALRESEEKFRLLLEAAPIATLIADQAGHITLVNDRAETLLGYQQQELIGKALSTLIPPHASTDQTQGQKPPAIPPFTENRQAGKRDLVARRKDGHEFPIEIEQAPIETRAGLLQICFIIDMTERQQITTALAEQSAFLRNVIDFSPSMIFVKDYNARFVLANPRLADMYNTTVDAILGRSDADFNPSAQEVADFLAADRQVITSGEPFFLEEPLTNPQGETRWLQTTKVPIVSADGQSKYVLGVATDITERKKTEEALRRNEELLRSVLENLPIGVWLLNGAGVITQSNSAGQQIWGGVKYIGLQDYATAYKAWWADTGQPVAVDEWGAVRAVTQGETVLNQELEIETFDGLRKYILNSAIPIRDTAQKLQGAIIVNQDITERKQNEKLIRQALAKEKELSELKSRFVSMASHEFRTPLATILALTETLIAYRTKLSEPQIEQRLGKIKSQIGHLQDIMEDVLQLARLQARRTEFNPVLLDLDVLCRSVIDEFLGQPGVAHRLQYHCEQFLHKIKLDKKLIRQIVNNLVSNAIKYSSPGQTIQIDLTHHNEALRLTVRDEGIGIPETDLPHLFEPFHRASNVGAISGTGLGLVITKEAVELHGGTIRVESQIGSGSTFTVDIPLVAPTET